jgi:tetratricopeptide (TPR) repeat protein
VTGSLAGAATSKDLVERGAAAREDGDLVGAVALFEQAIEHDPANLGAARESAFTLVRLGLLSLAEDVLERAISLRPDRDEVALDRGRIAARRGDAALAVRYFSVTTSKSPKSPRPYVLAAQQLRELGRHREALEVATRGLEHCGEGTAGHLDLLEERAVSLVALEFIDDGRKLIRTLLKLQKGVHSLWEAALVLTRRKRFAEALELVESLEADVRQQDGAALAYRGCTDAIQTGRAVFESSGSRVEQNPAAELLATRPYVFPKETPLDEIRSVAGVEHPTKCYLLDDPGADSPASELPPKLARLVEEDFALLDWGPGRRTRQICFQYLLQDCFVYDNGGADPHHTVVSRGGQYVRDLVTRNANPVILTGTALWDPAPALEAIDCAFVTPSAGWLNYGHVVVDILSTLAIYERLGLSCPIVVPGRVGNVHAELIRASGVLDETPVFTASDVRGTLLRVAVCPQAVSAQLLRDWCETVVQRTVGAADPEVRDQILYISRANSARRPLANEEQLEEMLRTDWGCRIVRIQDLSHPEQLRHAQQARLIIGPHGAGLTTTLFAPRTTPLIELLPTAYAKRYYAHLAAVSGRLYLPIFGPADKANVMDERDLRWRIDLDKVARVLDGALGAPHTD